MNSVFNRDDVATLIARVQRLTTSTTPAWGKMTVDQMLAHCSVSYEMVYEPAKHPKASFLKRFILKAFVKSAVVGPKPYARNTPTAPQFRMVGPKDFAREQTRLIAYLERVQQEGASAFEGRESPSFGPLSAAEWNTLFYKHLDHHLVQFGV